MTAMPPRSPRLKLSAPLWFAPAGTELRGHCRNLSESGLLATFGAGLQPGMEGSLRLDLAGWHTPIKARVARVDGRNAGLAFLLENSAEREVVAEALRLARRGLLPKRPPS